MPRSKTDAADKRTIEKNNAHKHMITHKLMDLLHLFLVKLKLFPAQNNIILHSISEIWPYKLRIYFTC